MTELLDKVQELKLQSWKGGYLSGLGNNKAAWEILPVLQGLIDDIESLAASNQPVEPTEEAEDFNAVCDHCNEIARLCDCD